MSKPAKRPFRRDLLICHSTGEIFGRISQRLNCAGGDISDRNFRSAEHHIYQAKQELKEGAWAIGKGASSRVSKLLDDPLQALKKAHQTNRKGKIGRVGRGRLRPAEAALMKVMKRASNKCK